MSDKELDPVNTTPSRRGIQWMQEAIPCAICALIVGIFVWLADSNSLLEPTDSDGAYYNLLVQGFSKGHLYVERNVPAALTRLANPYDPAANAPYLGPINDLSYYKGKLYLYFGITPALTFFGPYYLLTGHFLSDKDEVAFFFGIGFGVIAGLLRAARRRYFPGTSPWLIAASAIMPGLALALTVSANVYEDAIVCGFAFAMLALAAVWAALHAAAKHRVLWLSLASLAYGLAIGARPVLLFGAVILSLPVLRAWREEDGLSLRRMTSLFIAAAGPVTLAGLGLMLYNALRFGNPFEFGVHYMLTESYQQTASREFSLNYFWFNLRIYFFEFPLWSGHFPFLSTLPLPPRPHGYDAWTVSAGGGIPARYPIVGLIFAVPLAWNRRPAGTIAGLGWSVGAFSLLLITAAVTLCLYDSAAARYELDFLPGLLLLAAIGFYGVHRVASRFSIWRWIAVFGWFLLLLYSFIFNVLSNIEARAENHYLAGNSYFHNNHFDEAIAQYQKAELLWPDCADAHYGLGSTLMREGHWGEAIAEYQKALEIKPDSPEANNNLAFTLLQAGRVDDAIKYFQRASELQTNYQTFYNLGYAFRMKKMAPEAEINWQKAIELQPQFIPAQLDLSWMLATWPDASARNGDQALALMKNLDRQVPNDPRILRTLAAAYAETGNFSEAITMGKRALAIAQTEPGMTLVKKLQTEIALYQNNKPCRSFTN